MKLSLKKVFNVLKKKGTLIPAIDKYLLGLPSDNDRGHGLNSPSGVSSCPRSQVYNRRGEKRDGILEPRTLRIFNNGTHTHVRLQEYLLKCGLLLMDEVPVYSKKYQILGHTDGIIRLNKFSLAILEIKSINSNGFSNLIDAKDEHKEQAQVYMYCTEIFRQEIRKCKTKRELNKFRSSFLGELRKLMETFVVEGHKFTKEEKIDFELKKWDNLIDILWDCTKPITEMIFLYENKDNQELKEYSVMWDEERVAEILEKYEYINEYIEKDEIPDRPEEAKGKSSSVCRWCNYKYTCWK
jgi:hypothetical protein